MNKNLAEGLRWLEQARNDLQDATVLYEARSYATSCFLCQQSAEKAVKAFLYSKGTRAIISHSLLTLLKQAENYEKVFTSMVKLGRELDKHYIASRYPNFYSEGTPVRYYTKDIAKKCIRYATSILGTVTRFLSP